MRLKPGRPDLDRYADRFDVPAAEDGLSVTFLGVSSLLLDDGSSAILTDGFFSRPPMLSVLARRLAPDLPRIDACLAMYPVEFFRLGVPGFQIRIADRPGRRDAFGVLDFGKVFFAKPRQHRAIEFGVSADVIKYAGRKGLV